MSLNIFTKKQDIPKEMKFVDYNDLFFNRYLVQTEEDLPEDLIDSRDGLFVYTKRISSRQLEKIVKNAMFYARIEE